MIDFEDIQQDVPIKAILRLAVNAMGGAKVAARKVGVSPSLIAKWVEESPSDENPDLSGARTDAERIALMMCEAYNTNPESGEMAAYQMVKYFQTVYDAIQEDRQQRFMEKVDGIAKVAGIGWKVVVMKILKVLIVF